MQRRLVMRKTIEQEMASFCIKKVNEVKETNDKEKIKKFETNAKKLPSLIVSNGLIPTLAFYKKEDKKLVYNTINEWLKEKKLIENDALEDLVNSNSQILRLATIEVLAIANWLKRIVEAEIKED
jgi:CRISPR-associated protein Cmr5